MNYKINSFPKKPLENNENKQLFSFDVSYKGAKNFIFDTHENIYKIIKTLEKPNFYEDITYSNNIKLFIDFDDKIIFNTMLERDIYSEKIIENIVLQINSKLFDTFEINNTPIIILISSTLLKMSLHFIFPNIIFNNIYEMKYFMHDMSLIDKSVYRKGAFRMMYCSKLNKNNTLIYHNSLNYINNNDYELFLDASICYNDNKNKSIIKIKIPLLIKNHKIKANNKFIERNYIYKNINFQIIKDTLNKINSHDYNEWLLVAFCMKDLYLS